MKVIALKFKNVVGNVNIIDSGDLSARILHIFFALFFILVSSYVFFIGKIVFDTVSIKNLAKEEILLKNEVGVLEAKYLDLSSKIDLPLAFSLGFKETEKSFASRRAFDLSTVNIQKNEI